MTIFYILGIVCIAIVAFFGGLIICANIEVDRKYKRDIKRVFSE